MTTRRLTLFALTLLWLAGCGGDDGGPVGPSPLDTPEAYVDRGWDRFEDGDGAGAADDFQAALDLDVTYGPALAGHGWVLLEQADSDAEMRSAADRFDAALALGETGSYVTAGRAAARLGLGQWTGAGTDAASVLVADGTFVFAHRTSFNGADLMLIIAFAEAAVGDLDDALTAGDAIQDSGIDSTQPTSWVVGGVTYPSYAGAVLAHLAMLSESHAG